MRCYCVSAATQNCSQTCQQLAWIERLWQIVVGAKFKANNTIHLIAPCSQHQDGKVRGGSHAPADFETVEIRQHNIEDEGIKITLLHQLEPAASRLSSSYLEAKRPQVFADHGG